MTERPIREALPSSDERPADGEQAGPDEQPRRPVSTAVSGARPTFEMRGGGVSLRRLVGDVWKSRSLIRILGRKDFHAKYRRASFGMVWVIVLPIIQAAVLSVIFTKVVTVRGGVGGKLLPAFIYSGILPWSFFSSTVNGSVTSIVGKSNLSTRIYFPRAVFPLSTVFANFHGFVPALGVLILVSAIFVGAPGLHLLYLLPAVALLIALVTSFALVLAAGQVYFRDIRWIMSAVTQPWFFASGVFFSLEMVPDYLRPAIYANPAVGMIQLFRVATIGPEAPSTQGWEFSVLTTLAWTIGLMAIAALTYKRYDRLFADLL